MRNYLIVGLCLLLSVVSFSQETKICVGNISNNIKIGSLAGNKNLVFGVKNVAEEAISDKGYIIVGNNDSTYKISFEVVYFDVLQTSTGVSVFHKTDNETIIRVKGILTKGGKKVKEYLGTGKSSEISTSTMIIDEGGGFNQASARSALKKTIVNVIENLL
jgi:uncharacterized lipoprotein YajG